MYVSDFRVSLNARISRGNQYPHVSQSLLYTPVFPRPLIDHLAHPLSFLRYTDRPPCLYSLAGAAPSLVPCTVYHPYAEWSGGKRNGAVRPSASDECDLKRESEIRPPAFLLWCLHNSLSTTRPPSPCQTRSLSTNPFHYHLLSSINFHHVNLPTYLSTPPSFLYPGSYISPKSTHNYKTFNLNVKLKRNGFSRASTVSDRSSRPISLRVDSRYKIECR